MARSILISVVAFLILAADTQHDIGNGSFLHPDVRRIYSGENVIGADTAPVTLIAYVNFECPYCNEFHQNILPQLKAEFIDKGKLKLVYRVFPMTNSLTGRGMLTAELAGCAAQYGHFWQLAPLLFNHHAQDFWTNYNAWIDESAPEVSAELNSCISFHKTRHHVIANQQRYAAHEITMTPTIIINGRKFVGTQPYEKYHDLIDSLIR